MRESSFQKKLVDELRAMFQDCIILKNDPEYLQGVPDLLILWKNKWAALECKANSRNASSPNQGYYIDQMRKMSFAAFIHPGNKETVLNDLQLAFKSRRSARISGSK